MDIIDFCNQYKNTHTLTNGLYKVYCHKNMINNKMYVGITKQVLELRFGPNGVHYKGCPHFYNAIQKYGWENFNHIILFNNISINDANYLEKLLISNFNLQDKNYGYNIADGGDSYDHNKYITDESRLKMSKSQKKRFETQSHPWTGRHHTEESIQKMRQHSPNNVSVRCVETGIIYPSIYEATRQLGLKSKNSIITAINRHTKCKNYHWEKVEK